MGYFLNQSLLVSQQYFLANFSARVAGEDNPLKLLYNSSLPVDTNRGEPISDLLCSKNLYSMVFQPALLLAKLFSQPSASLTYKPIPNTRGTLVLDSSSDSYKKGLSLHVTTWIEYIGDILPFSMGTGVAALNGSVFADFIASRRFLPEFIGLGWLFFAPVTLFRGKILSILTTVTQPFSDKQVPLVQHFHAQGKIILLRVIYLLLLSLLITIASIVDPSWIDSIVSDGLFYFTGQCDMPYLFILHQSWMLGGLI